MVLTQKRLAIIIGIFMSVLAFLTYSYIVKDRNPIITFSQDSLTVEVNDSNFTTNLLAYYVRAKTKETDETIPFHDLEISGDVDISRIGSYPISIKAMDGEYSRTKEFVINVVDTTAPVFHVVDEVIKVYKNEPFDPDPLTNLLFVSDNYDGMMTDKVTYQGEYKSGKVGEYPITYTAVDSSGNSSSVTITYKIVDTRDEFLHYIYQRTIDFYWGKYFVVDENNKILNYDDAMWYNFTNAGTAQFERACGLQENTDRVECGCVLERRDEDVYLTDKKDPVINNYISTEFFIVSELGKIVTYRAEVLYDIGNDKTLTIDQEFAMKKVYKKYYVESFILPTS